MKHHGHPGSWVRAAIWSAPRPQTGPHRSFVAAARQALWISAVHYLHNLSGKVRPCTLQQRCPIPAESVGFLACWACSATMCSL
jgi:hypothetical protein